MRKIFIYIASFLLLFSLLTKMSEGLFAGLPDNKVFIENTGDEKKEAEKEKNGMEDKISYGHCNSSTTFSVSLINTNISISRLSPGFKILPFLPPDIS